MNGWWTVSGNPAAQLYMTATCSKIAQRQVGVNIHQGESMSHDHKRGPIRDNALKALVTSSLFRTRQDRARKGKGSYSRKPKHRKGVQETMLNRSGLQVA